MAEKFLRYRKDGFVMFWNAEAAKSADFEEFEDDKPPPYIPNMAEYLAKRMAAEKPEDKAVEVKRVGRPRKDDIVSKIEDEA